MTKYIIENVNVTEGQKNKIKQAMEAGTGVTIRLGPNDLAGEHALALTESQINKMENAYGNKTGATIKISKTQQNYNKNRAEGGFIAVLARLLATAGKYCFVERST